MSIPMGLSAGFSRCIKRKFRWLFKIDGITENPGSSSVNALPHERSARPSFNFKEMEVQHMFETFYFPAKADWKTISLTLYDIKTNKNPVIDWINLVYNAEKGTWGPAANVGFKKNATLEMLNGCGDVIESWRYENVWPQIVEFGELDMASMDYVVIDLTLRYDRAFLI